MNITDTKKGFVILFTVLISSIILAIALGVASISYREVLLSGTAKDAQYSFFSADTGAECALYWDIQQVAFSQTPIVPSCHGSAVTMRSSSSPFVFEFSTTTAGCAVVTVDKDDPATTKIESLGYNVSCADLALAQTVPNSRIVERAIRVTYGTGEAPSTNSSTTNSPNNTTINANANPSPPPPPPDADATLNPQ